MMQLKALKPFRYARRALRPGDVFEATSKDGRLLKAVRRAADHVELEPMIGRDPEPPPKVADDPPTPPRATQEPATENVRPQRYYRRRDMTAEEDLI
jgi:hypothetical protein